MMVFIITIIIILLLYFSILRVLFSGSKSYSSV